MPKRRRQPESSFAEREYEHGREQLAGDFYAWQAVHERIVGMPDVEDERLDPGLPVASLLGSGGAAVLGVTREQVRVARLKESRRGHYPAPVVAGPFEVSVEGVFQGATMLLRFDADAVRGTSPSTVRVFRREPAGGPFTLCSASGVGLSHDYAWARIASPGVYAAIGLSSDALLLTALEALAVVRPIVLTAPRAKRRQYLAALVKAILATPAARAWLAGEVEETLTRAVLANGLPCAFTDEDGKRASHDDVLALAERAADEYEPVELQLLHEVRGTERL